MQPSESRAIVRAGLLPAMALFQSTEVTRFYLGGTYIEPHERGASLVATDGHTLAAHLDEGALVMGPAAIWAVPLQPLKSLLTAARKSVASLGNEGGVWCDLSLAGARVVVAESPATVADGHGVVIGSIAGGFLLDGVFPEWTAAVGNVGAPDPTARMPILDGRFLSRLTVFYQVIKKAVSCDKDANPPVPYILCPGATNCFSPKDDQKAAVHVFFDGLPDTLALVMSMNGPKIRPKIPTWISEMLPKIERAKKAA